MIPDLLHPHQIRRFIFDSTGQWIRQGTIKRWLKSGEITRIKLQNGKFVTRKKFVLDFIRRNSNG